VLLCLVKNRELLTCTLNQGRVSMRMMLQKMFVSWMTVQSFCDRGTIWTHMKGLNIWRTPDVVCGVCTVVKHTASIGYSCDAVGKCCWKWAAVIYCIAAVLDIIIIISAHRTFLWGWGWNDPEAICNLSFILKSMLRKSCQSPSQHLGRLQGKWNWNEKEKKLSFYNIFQYSTIPVICWFSISTKSAFYKCDNNHHHQAICLSVHCLLHSYMLCNKCSSCRLYKFCYHWSCNFRPCIHHRTFFFKSFAIGIRGQNSFCGFYSLCTSQWSQDSLVGMG